MNLFELPPMYWNSGVLGLKGEREFRIEKKARRLRDGGENLEDTTKVRTEGPDRLK